MSKQGKAIPEAALRFKRKGPKRKRWKKEEEELEDWAGTEEPVQARLWAVIPQDMGELRKKVQEGPELRGFRRTAGGEPGQRMAGNRDTRGQAHEQGR